jgi:hypothetical protein
MATSLSVLRYGRRCTPPKHFSASGTDLCQGPSKHQGLVRLKRLGKSIKIVQLLEPRTRDLPVVTQGLNHCTTACHHGIEVHDESRKRRKVVARSPRKSASSVIQQRNKTESNKAWSQAGRPRSHGSSPSRVQNVLISTPSKPGLGSTNSHIQW